MHCQEGGGGSSSTQQVGMHNVTGGWAVCLVPLLVQWGGGAHAAATSMLGMRTPTVAGLSSGTVVRWLQPAGMGTLAGACEWVGQSGCWRGAVHVPPCSSMPVCDGMTPQRMRCVLQRLLLPSTKTSSVLPLPLHISILPRRWPPVVSGRLPSCRACSRCWGRWTSWPAPWAARPRTPSA